MPKEWILCAFGVDTNKQAKDSSVHRSNIAEESVASSNETKEINIIKKADQNVANSDKEENGKEAMFSIIVIVVFCVIAIIIKYFK